GIGDCVREGKVGDHALTALADAKACRKVAGRDSRQVRGGCKAASAVSGATLVRRLFVVLTLALACVGLPPRAAQAGGGPLGIDHRVAFDNSGIWARSNQKFLMGATVVSVIGGSVVL